MHKICTTDREFVKAVFKSRPEDYMEGIFETYVQGDLFPLFVPYYMTQYAIESGQDAWLIYMLRRFEPGPPKRISVIKNDYGVYVDLMCIDVSGPNIFAAKRPAKTNRDEEVIGLIKDIQGNFADVVPDIMGSAGAFHLSPNGRIFCRGFEGLAVTARAEMGTMQIEGDTLVATNNDPSVPAARAKKYVIEANSPELLTSQLNFQPHV